MTLYSHRALYILVAGIAIIAVFFIWFDYRFLYTNIVSLSGEITRMRQESSYLRGRLFYFPLVENEEHRMKREQEKFRVFPSFAAPLDFLFFLEETAKASGNQIHIAVQEGKTQTFTVSITGSFNDLQRFLVRLKTTAIEIQLKRIGKIKGGEGETSLLTELTLVPQLSS